MEPAPVHFAIQCTTCKGRLVVRNAQAIGQILPCPKCGSMVLVEPPAGYTPPAPANAAGEAPPAAPPQATTPPTAQKPVAQQPVDQRPAAPPQQPTAAGSPAAPPGQKEISGGRPMSPRARAAQDMGSVSETVDDSTILSRSDFPTPPPTIAGEEPVEGPLLPSQAALPSEKWRKPLLWGGGGVAVVLVGILLLGFLFSGGGEEPQTAQTPEDEGQQESDTPPADGSTPPATVPEDQETSEELNPSADPPAEPPPVDAEQDPAPLDEPEPADEGEEDADDDASPLVIDDSPPVPLDTQIDDLFGQFDALVDPGQEVDPPPPDANPAEPDADLTADWPDLPLRDRPPFAPVDVAARLNDPIAAISLEGTRLRELLRLVSGMTTIPLTIDPEALAQAHVSLDEPITLSLNETTVGELLSVALAPHGLALQPAEGCANIIRATPAEGLRSVRYELADLTEGDPQALETLAGMLRDLAPAASWSDAGGPATWEIEGDTIVIAQSEPLHYQMAQLCEKLRLARGLPVQESLAPATLDSRSQQLQEKLATTLRLNYPEPTLLRTILDRLEREAGVTILVDWQTLIAFGWPGNSQATLTIDEGTLEEALYRLLAPMELAWRAVDAETLEITTQDALATRLELEVYPLADETVAGLEPHAVADHILIDLGVRHFQRGGGTGILWYDQESGALLALLPQPTQQQLENMLRTWRPFAGG